MIRQEDLGWKEGGPGSGPRLAWVRTKGGVGAGVVLMRIRLMMSSLLLARLVVRVARLWYKVAQR